jgi:hypothetical protein
MDGWMDGWMDKTKREQAWQRLGHSDEQACNENKFESKSCKNKCDGNMRGKPGAGVGNGGAKAEG